MAEENCSGASSAKRKSNRNLPEELQDEILRRLPVESLTRFGSVCKTWQSKFHSQGFIDFYGRHHPSGISSDSFKLPIGISNNSLEIHTIRRSDLFNMVPELDIKIDTQQWQSIKAEEWRRTTLVLGPSSNGIYCLTSHPSDLYGDRFCVFLGKIALCNPATRQYKLTNPYPSHIRALLGHIASKPCRLHFGFGKTIDGDYKVVVIVNYGKSLSSFLGFVYSLRSGVWKKLVDYKRGKRNIGHRKATQAFNSVGRISDPIELCPQGFFEGCWHWAAIGEDKSSDYVLSFDFADEAFKLIGAPSRPRHRFFNCRGSVSVLHDHLAFIYLSHVMSPSPVEVEVDVWMMMEYGFEKSWTLIHKIDPFFNAMFLRIVGIDYTTPPEDEKNGVICIERLFFEDHEHDIISCDDLRFQILRRDPCEESDPWNSSAYHFLNTPGISTYAETLELL